MLTDLDLLNLHVRALFTCDDRDRLFRVNEPNGAIAPRFFLGRTADGSIRRYRHDLSNELVESIEAVCLAEAPLHRLNDYLEGNTTTRFREVESEILHLLSADTSVQKISRGPAYVFPEKPPEPATRTIRVTSENIGVLNNGLEDWIADVPDRQPFAALEMDGRAVAVCCSVRITPEAHEAGVEVLQEHRRKGYAVDVCSRWATDVKLLGCTPLYSTSWENTASKAVARKLGLKQYGVTFHAH